MRNSSSNCSSNIAINSRCSPRKVPRCVRWINWWNFAGASWSDKVRLTNRLTSALKNYFPQVLSWFSDKDTTIFCDFLTQWPTLKAVHLARRATLERFFRQHHVQTRVIAQRLQAIKTRHAAHDR